MKVFKRWARILSLTALTGLACLYAAPPAWLGRGAGFLARDLLGIPITIQALDIRLPLRVELRGVEIAAWERPPFRLEGGIQNLKVSLSAWRSLTRGRLWLSRLSMEEARIKAVFTPGRPSGSASPGPGGPPRLPLEMEELSLVRALILIETPWAQASARDLELRGRLGDFRSLSWRELSASWKALRLERIQGPALAGEPGSLSLLAGASGYDLAADLPFGLEWDRRQSRSLPGRVQARLRLPKLESLASGVVDLSGGLSLALAGKPALELKAEGGQKEGRLKTSLFDLPLGRLLLQPGLEGLRLKGKLATLAWKDGALKGSAELGLEGLPKLAGAAQAPPALTLRLGLSGQGGGGRLKIHSDGRVDFGSLFKARFSGGLESSGELKAEAGLEQGSLDLRALGTCLPLPAELRLEGLASVDGPRLRWNGRAAKVEALLDSRGSAFIWSPGEGEAVTATQEGLKVVLDGDFRSQPRTELEGSLDISQDRQVLAGPWGRIEIPRPRGRLEFHAPLGLHPELGFALNLRHEARQPPASLVRSFTLEGEASLAEGELKASMKGGLPDLGGSLDGSWRGRRGTLTLDAAPSPRALKPYLDRVAGRTRIQVEAAWPRGSSPRVESLTTVLEGLTVARNEFSSGLLSGELRWRPERSQAPAPGRGLSAWTRDLVPPDERGSPLTVTGLVYGDLKGDLELTALLRGTCLSLSQIQGRILSGGVRGGGDLRWRPGTGLLYRLELAGSGLQPRAGVPGPGLALNVRVEGENMDAPEGQVNVTRISNKDLSALLLKLDPDGKNQALVNGRRKLALGFVPQNTSFTIRHGQAVLDCVLKPGDFKSALTLTVTPLRVEFPLTQTLSVFLNAEQAPLESGSTESRLPS